MPYSRALAFTFALLASSMPTYAQHWVASWGAAQQIPEPQNALPADTLQNATLRQIVHLSLGGTSIRVHVSNAFGTLPLHVLAAHIARPLTPATSETDPQSDRALTFGESATVSIPPGAEYISDPLPMSVQPLTDLAITLQIESVPGQQTGHPGSRATSYITSAVPAKPVDHWYFLSGIDVLTSNNAASIIAFGDSITDGHGCTTNGNDRWTDDLAQRLQTNKHPSAVINVGIGGNHLLTDGLGPNALARFDRDVLARAGATQVIILEGVNDLGKLSRESPNADQATHDALVHDIIAAYQQIITRAHAAGLHVIGGTILPFTGSDYYHPNAAIEQDRQRVNTWIRQSSHFDAVIDFDKALGDPDHPNQLLPKYDGGDHLHPNVEGYKAMAEAISLKLF